MADDQIPASPTPAGDPLPATPASVQPLDFSAVAGHQQHGPAPQPNVHVDPAAQYVKNTETQQAGEKEYSDFLYKNSPDEYRKADPVGYFARKIHGVISEAAARGIEHDPEYLKQAVAPHVQALADFASGQLGVTPGSLGHTAGLAASPLMPEGGFNMEDAASVQRVPEGVETPANLKSANPKLKNALPARPEVGQKINFDAVAGHEEVAPPEKPPEAIGVHPDDLPHRANYQAVNFAARDLQDTGPKVTEKTIRKDYASNNPNVSVYQSYIPMEDMPSPNVVEEEEGGDFDREEYSRPRTGVPIKVEVGKDGKLNILDGNHRVRVWEEQNQQYAPAWVVDHRHPNIEHLSEDEKAERDAELEEENESGTVGTGYGKTIPTGDPKSIVESAGGTYRGKNGAGLVEITLPREMTDASPGLQDRFKDFVSITMPESEVNPESVKREMDRKFLEMGGSRKAQDSPKVGQPKNEPLSAEDYENYQDSQDRVAQNLLSEFQTTIGKKGYRQQWDTVPAGRLKKIWNDYANLGFVRDEKGIDQIANTLQTNIHKIEVNNILSGHSSLNPEEYAEEITGQEFPKGYFEQNENFFDDENGNWRLSDYAADDLTNASLDLRRAKTAEQKLQIIDHILNITHQRSDLSSWFVEGGQKTLNDLAGKSYHPDLQKVADTHKVTDDPYKISHGSSFITPDGQYVHLPTGTSHADAIDAAKGKPGQEGLSTHSRKMFQNDTGAIKTKVTFDPETGHTLHVTVPDSGVNPEQVQALVKAAKQALGGGKKGKVVMETASRKQSAEKSDAKPEDIEPMLRNIGSHPKK